METQEKAGAGVSVNVNVNASISSWPDEKNQGNKPGSWSGLFNPPNRLQPVCRFAGLHFK
jgi:hypothetical protein